MNDDELILIQLNMIEGESASLRNKEGQIRPVCVESTKGEEASREQVEQHAGEIRVSRSYTVPRGHTG